MELLRCLVATAKQSSSPSAPATSKHIMAEQLIPGIDMVMKTCKHSRICGVQPLIPPAWVQIPPALSNGAFGALGNVFGQVMVHFFGWGGCAPPDPQGPIAGRWPSTKIPQGSTSCFPPCWPSFVVS